MEHLILAHRLIAILKHNVVAVQGQLVLINLAVSGLSAWWIRIRVRCCHVCANIKIALVEITSICLERWVLLLEDVVGTSADFEPSIVNGLMITTIYCLTDEKLML